MEYRQKQVCVTFVNQQLFCLQVFPCMETKASQLSLKNLSRVHTRNTSFQTLAFKDRLKNASLIVFQRFCAFLQVWRTTVPKYSKIQIAFT